MSTGADFIIVGGGILGCAVAYYLAGLKQGQVLLLERRTIAGANSPRAAGLLSRPRLHGAVIPMVQETYAAIQRLEAEFGHPLGLRRVGSLHIAASAGTKAYLDDLVGVSSGHGVTAEWISAADAERLAPWLALDRDITVAYFAEDAVVDPYTLTQAYARAARERGAQMRQGVGVTALRTEGTRVLGVESTDGFVAGGTVIDAAGAWAGVLAWQLGIGLPMAPVRSQYWLTAPHALFSGQQPIVLLPDARAYARIEIGRLLFGLRETTGVHFDPWGLPEDIASLRLSADPNGWDALTRGINGLARFFPAIQRVGIATYVAGLSTYTPDGNFLLGGLPGVEGLLFATGCSGAGIAASGGIGRALAQLAAGEAPSFDLTPHRIDRFGWVDPTDPVFRQRCAAARAMKQSG